MENASEALKIAFAVLLFVMALTLSISSFSQANEAVRNITTLRDRESQYTYVEPSANLTRTVGIETVVSTMYRSYKENIEIHFFQDDGVTVTPFALYNDTDIYGNITEQVYCINLANEGFASQQAAKEHLDIIVGGSRVLNQKELSVRKAYKNVLIPRYQNGLYDVLKNEKFEEKLGEYYQGSGATEVKKRVITYIMK